MLTTLPTTVLPSGYFSSIPSHGLSLFCFKPKETFTFSLSKSSTFTSTSSLILTISLGWLTRPQLISVMCKSPVIPPPISINAPKSVIFRTTPFTRSPLFSSSSIAFFSSRLFSSTNSFLERTIFLRGILIFTILKSNFLPTMLSGPPNSCIAERLAGRNACIPTSTIKPPLTFLVTLPLTRSPSELFSIISCQLFCLLAFS